MSRPHLVAIFGGAAVLLAASPGAAQPAQNPPPAELQNPDRAASANMQNAAEAPLHDLNLVRQKIPPILLAALADPYARPAPATCRELDDQIRVLTDALGADFDAPYNPQEPSLTTQRGVALTLAHGAAESLLPFAGFVRALSGAQKHDQLVAEVITAGSVRRGYLKGLGEAHGCAPPALPRHLVSAAEPYREERKPTYPIH
ncbi:MAG: hypothetical protein M3T55_07760 [Pseudomonadota bacterium]|nr:hypothetical protein [Pseudomonadota bacterium]